MEGLQYLLEKHAIEQVYIRYCELIDAKNFARLDEVFTPDTVGDYTQTYGPGAIRRGLPILVELMLKNLGPGAACGATQHNVANFRIAVDGDAAASTAKYYAIHRGAGAVTGICSMWGEYHDSWLRTPAGWRIRHRLYRTLLTDGPTALLFPMGDRPVLGQ